MKTERKYFNSLMLVFIASFIYTTANSQYADINQAGFIGSEYYEDSNNVDELIKLNIVQINNAVKITWTSFSENYNYYYIIQKSTDGVNYDDIGYLSGKREKNNINNHIFYDRNLCSGNCYYKIVNKDSSDLQISSVIYAFKLIDYFNDNPLHAVTSRSAWK
jgi:hypothetical protein